jgi:outer membrane protein assembly factor BamD
MLCFLLLISCSTNKKAENPLDNLTPEQLYNEGIKNINHNSYDKSIAYFERINQEYPYSPFAGKAQIMEAYAYYRTSQFEYSIAALDDYISLYPGEKNIEYAYYLKSLCYYDQIVNVKLDQLGTEKAKEALTDVINRFPESEYARDAKFKLNLVLDHLAGKEMEVGRFYLKKRDMIAAINRFKAVVDNYQTTSQIEEALYRLVECYHIIGVEEEAKRYAAVLGNNYPESRWFKDAYKIVNSKK